MARYKKTKRIAAERNAERAVTVGEFLDAVFAVSTNRSTIEGYATAFRKIVADLFGFSSDPEKFDYRSGGRDQWLAKVHSVELSNITPAKIQEWRKEIDLVEWSSFRFKDGVIRIEPTQFFHPKSQDSIAEIQVDPEIMAIFRRYHAKAKGGFVIPSGKPPKTVSRGDYYGCESHFDRLNAWLRSKGVNAQKPVHTLHKVYGSLIIKAHGIHGAGKATNQNQMPP